MDTDQEHEKGDPDPCPEDEGVFVGPDSASMEEAICKFLDGLEGQERSGFKNVHSFLAKLPVPVTKKSRSMTHTQALEGGFLPEMDEEERFDCIYLFIIVHTCLHKYMTAYTRSYQCILVYTCIHQNVHAFMPSTQRFAIHTSRYHISTYLCYQGIYCYRQVYTLTYWYIQ